MMSGRKRRNRSDEANDATPKKRNLADEHMSSNVFGGWNTEISLLTDTFQSELTSRADNIYDGIGKELEQNTFEYCANEDDFFLGLLRNDNVEKNISDIIKALEDYLESTGFDKKRSVGSEESFSRMRRLLNKSYSKLADNKIVRDNNFVIREWSCLLPILLSDSLSNMDLSIILEKVPKIVAFLVKSLRKFQVSTGKSCFENSSAESATIYRKILENYKVLNGIYSRINTVSVNCLERTIQDPFTLYINKILKRIPGTKMSHSFIQTRFKKEISNNIFDIKYKLDSNLLSAPSALYMIYGSNISSLGVFGASFLKKRANLDNLWQLKLFNDRFRILRIAKNKERDYFFDDFGMERLDKFIGSLGYGVSSLDPLLSMNPRPEMNKREANNVLRYHISKKVHKRYSRETKIRSSEARSDLCKIPLLSKGYTSSPLDEQNPVFKDFSKFPSIPNREPAKCGKAGNLEKKSRRKSDPVDFAPLGFLSSSKLKAQRNRELELLVFDIKEVFRGNKNLGSVRFDEYGLFWKNSSDESSNDGNSKIYFKLIPLRSCTASINHSTKFKSHIYFLRFLLEEVVNSNWRKKLITKNKKYYKLSSLVNGGFLSKSQKESINKITKVITNNDLWENYSDIIPKILTRSEKGVTNNELQEWEDFDENDKFDSDLSKMSKLSNKGFKSSEFYGKYLKLSSNNYKLVSKRCQKMLAKYIFKQYPRFLLQYYKMRKEWKEFNTNETAKKNKSNTNNSSKLQLEIIGHSGSRNVKAQLQNFQDLNIKHDPDNTELDNSRNPQIQHLLKMEKQETNNEMAVLPAFDKDLPLNMVFRLGDFSPEGMDGYIDIEWNKAFIAEDNIYFNSFIRLLFTSIEGNSVFSQEYKSFFLKVLVLINWLIYLLNNTNKSFGGPRGVKKCLDSYFERGNHNKYSQKCSGIPIEICNWALNTFMSKYRSENLQIRYGFSSTGKNKLFVTILWLCNYVSSHTNNLSWSEYNVFKIPEYLPSGNTQTNIDFHVLLSEDLRDKFTRKFCTLAFALGFRSVKPPPKNFKARNYSIPPNVTLVALSSYPNVQ